MTDEQQIAALREEIRRAGSRLAAGRSRWLGCCAAIAVLAGILAACAALGCASYPYPEQRSAYLHLFLVEAAVGVPAALAAGIVGLMRFRRLRHRRRLEADENLRRLPSEKRAEVLRPLIQDSSADTRQIALLLLGESPSSLEVSPTSAPGVPGNEASPAE